VVLERIQTPMRYDPHSEPEPGQWLAMDESERTELVRTYHRRKGTALPNALLHAAIHVTVENQIAIGHQLPVKRKLADLLSEGLDRHEAIHAIGSVLAEHMYHLMKGELQEEDPNPKYFEALSQLTAKSWREYYSSDNDR
jgi:hypothetical protein